MGEQVELARREERNVQHGAERPVDAELPEVQPFATPNATAIEAPAYISSASAHTSSYGRRLPT